MKILHIINNLAGGGAERLISQLAPLMNQNGNSCDVLVLSAANSVYIEPLQKSGVTVLVSPHKSRFDFRHIFYIAKTVKQGGYNVVHAHIFPAVYWASLAARLFARKHALVTTEHGTFNRRRNKKWLRPLEKFIYRKYKTVISISVQTQEALLQWLKPRQTEKYVTVENGIDLELFSKTEPLLRSELGVSNDAFLVGVIGTFSPVKNQAAIIRALGLFPQNTHIIFAGTGPLLNDCVSLAESLGVKERAHFIGFRRDVERVMKTVDIVAVPSLWEGFCLAAVEAMACGKPLAASNVPGLREVVGNGGVLFEPTDHNDIAEKINALITNSPLREQCAAAALARSQNYGIEKTLAGYMGVYAIYP